MMDYILADDGFDVVSSQESVTEAYVETLSPALILLDNRLADGFGHDICARLKANPATRHFPVILVSAVNQLPVLADECFADAYLSKPFDLEELVALVRRFT